MLKIGIIQCYTFEQEIRDTYFLSILQGVEKYLRKNKIASTKVRYDDLDIKKYLKVLMELSVLVSLNMGI